MQIFAFGPFRLVPCRQELLRGQTRIRIGARALDLLVALVERAGDVVSKSELMARVWPTTTVDESNLKVNIAALRRALGDDVTAVEYIATMSGRGYRFIAPVEMETVVPRHAAGAVHRSTLPARGRQASAIPDVVPYDPEANGTAIDGGVMLQFGETVLVLRIDSIVEGSGPGFSGQSPHRVSCHIHLSPANDARRVWKGPDGL